MTVKPINTRLSALLLSCAFTSVDAASILLSPDNLDVVPGEVIAVEISYDFTDFATFGGGVDVFFDPAVLTFEDFMWVDNTPPGDLNFAMEPNVGIGALTGMGFGSFSGIADSATFAILMFRVQGVHRGSATEITLEPNGAFPFLDAMTLDPLDVEFGQSTVNLTPDSDDDGVPDSIDNCSQHANADQVDTNADGFGNRCDADLNDDCDVNFGDLALLKAAFTPNPYDEDADFDGDGNVNFGDLAFMKATFFNGENPGPGPSGLPNDCD